MNDDKTLRIILFGLLIFLVGVIVSGLTGIWIGKKMERENITQHTETTYVTKYDTIPCYFPEPKDSMVVRYVTKTLATKPQGIPPATEPQDSVPQDSVTVEIPITQKVYEADSYRAYVSGYEPNLDSIFVRQKTVQETITVPFKQKQDRFGFGIGIGAGYGIINKKPDIFVGGTVYMRVF